MKVVPRYLTVLIAFLGILSVLRWSFPYFGPFYLGLLLAFFLDVPVSYLEAKGWSRHMTSLILAGTAFFTLPGVMTFLLIQMWQEVQGLAQVSGFLSAQAQLLLASFAPILQVLPSIDTGFSLQTLGKWLWAIPDFLLLWTISAFSAYLLCRDKRVLTKIVLKELPVTWSFNPRQLYHDTASVLWHYIQVQLLFMFISTGLSAVFFFVLELPYPLLAAFFVGFFDLCPILGPGLVYFTLAMVQTWLGNPLTALALGLGYLVLLLLRQWGEPQMVSDRLGLHPLTALVSLYAGFRLWPPIGALIGPVLMVLLKVFIRKD
ncbi:MAG: AI-2E family transporter [Firmicutes bacterium]|nr:AI-2E family transporter [Bacillota bacterium]